MAIIGLMTTSVNISGIVPEWSISDRVRKARERRHHANLCGGGGGLTGRVGGGGLEANGLDRELDKSLKR